MTRNNGKCLHGLFVLNGGIWYEDRKEPSFLQRIPPVIPSASIVLKKTPHDILGQCHNILAQHPLSNFSNTYTTNPRTQYPKTVCSMELICAKCHCCREPIPKSRKDRICWLNTSCDARGKADPTEYPRGTQLMGDLFDLTPNPHLICDACRDMLRMQSGKVVVGSPLGRQ